MIFDKVYTNGRYALLFNTKTGLEILSGVDGNEDPFSLSLPSLLDVGIMGHCKHKCPFCYQGHEDEPNMCLDDFKLIIDAVKHHTNQVALGGRGDPNHHENFREIIEYARKNDVVPNYTTSGIDLTDEHIEISKLCGAVAVSDYEKDYTYDAIERLIKAGIKTNIHQMFTRLNYAKCMSMTQGYDVWKKGVKERLEGLNAVIFLLFKNAGAGRILAPGWTPLPNQLRKFSEYLFKPNAPYKLGMDSCLVNHVLQHVKPTEIQRMSVDTCEGARMSAYITPDMRLMPCSFANKNAWAIPIVQTNKKKTIDYIWNRSLKFKQFRSILKKNNYCCPLGV